MIRLATMSSVCPDWSLDEVIEGMKRYGYLGLEPRVEWGHACGIEASLSADERRGVRERMEWASQVKMEDVAAGKERLKGIRKRIHGLLQEGDVLCLPTSPRVAPLRDTPTDDIEIRFRNQAMCLLCIAGLGGLPQVSLPLATMDGLPLGLSLVGPPGADEHLLALAQNLLPKS